MKPILFNTPMTQAVWDGIKTETRRVVKEPYYIDKPDVCMASGLSMHRGINATHGMSYPDRPYEPGDILYVRETWRIQAAHRFDADARIEFKAGGPMSVIQFPGGKSQSHNRESYDDFISKWGVAGGWHPSIHMPKEAARLFLRVTGVRVERLQTPFFEQGSTIFALQAEGVDIGDHCRQCIENYGGPCCNDLDPDFEFDEDADIWEDDNGGSECGMLDVVRYDLSRLWDSTIKQKDLAAYGWSANPWVWVIQFEKISREEAITSDRPG